MLKEVRTVQNFVNIMLMGNLNQIYSLARDVGSRLNCRG